MAKQAKKTKKAAKAKKASPSKGAKSASKARSRRAMKTVAASSKKAGPKAIGNKKPTKTAKKKSDKKMMAQESRDAHHNMVMDQSTDYMTEHGQMPKRRGTRAKAPKTIERTAKPEAIPIRQPQLHSEN